jgi:hypothetical protein
MSYKVPYLISIKRNKMITTDEITLPMTTINQMPALHPKKKYYTLITA